MAAKSLFLFSLLVSGVFCFLKPPALNKPPALKLGVRQQNPFVKSPGLCPSVISKRHAPSRIFAFQAEKAPEKDNGAMGIIFKVVPAVLGLIVVSGNGAFLLKTFSSAFMLLLFAPLIIGMLMQRFGGNGMIIASCPVCGSGVTGDKDQAVIQCLTCRSVSRVAADGTLEPVPMMFEDMYLRNPRYGAVYTERQQTYEDIDVEMVE
mmetsp:Transcript_6532/g.9861  ORF Transcript_6532/g.9861 Transcript_6532/m.9861 type:complete len:206 (+) Transcript_6532:48-665(+)